jgi:PAS domain S-box-containing protein
MKKSRLSSPDARTLRRQAEQKLRAQPLPTEPPMSESDARALVHELQVHQIELELQNDELLRTQTEAQQAAEKYTELFDFAPIAYFVLDARGLIREVNLAGATLLGLDRCRVTGQPFEQYLVQDCRMAFSAFCGSVQSGVGRRAFEVRLLRHDRGLCDVLVAATPARDISGAGPGCRLAVADISERKRAEEKLRQFNAELERQVAERTADLRARNQELTRFNLGLVGRELRMVELKSEVNELCRQAGQPARYPSDAQPEPPATPGDNPTPPGKCGMGNG